MRASYIGVLSKRRKVAVDRRRFLWACIGLAGLLWLPSVASATDRPPERLTILTALAPSHLDPHRSLSGPDFQMMGHVYDTLVKRDGFRPVPGLLSGWLMLDPKRWRLTVTPGRQFSTGAPVTARDIAYSLCRWMTLNRHPQNRPLGLSRVTWTDSAESKVLEVELSVPTPRLLSHLSLIHGVQAPAQFIGRECTGDLSPGLLRLSEQPVGSGPYRLASTVAGKSYQLDAVRIDGRVSAPFEQVVFRVERDAQRRVRMLTDGLADIIEDPPPAPLAYLGGLPNLRLTELLTDRTLFLNVNLTGPQPGERAAQQATALTRLPVRQALLMAIDPVALAQRATDGYGIPATQLAQPGMQGHVPDRLPPQADPARSRALLAASGYGDGLSLELLVPTLRGNDGGRLAETLSNMLSAAGFRINIMRVERDEYRQRLREGQFDLALNQIGIDDGDALSGFDAMLRPAPVRTLFNPGRYQDPTLADLLARADAATGEGERQAAIADIQALIDRDLPFIPLLYMRDVVLHRADLNIQSRDSSRLFGLITQPSDGPVVR